MEPVGLGKVVCVAETPKAFKFQKPETQENPFWVPKKMIELPGWQVGFIGDLVVSSWWVSQVRNRTHYKEGPSPHSQGLCKVCLEPYESHPPKIQRYRVEWREYLTLCDGGVFNLQSEVKTTLGNFHTPEWWAEVEEVQKFMGCWNGTNCHQQHLQVCTIQRCINPDWKLRSR